MVHCSQLFDRVRCKIDNQQTAARLQHTRGFGDHGRWFIGEMQHLVHQHEIVRMAGRGQSIHVALSRLHVWLRRSFQCFARDAQHVLTDINPEGASGPRSDQLEHASGTGANIQHARNRCITKRVLDRLLHFLFVDVQRPYRIPVCGGFTEVGLRMRSALRTNHIEALSIRREAAVIVVHVRDELLDQHRCERALGQSIKHPRAFGESLDQSTVGQKLEMPGHTRLRLRQNAAQLRNGGFTMREEREEAKPGGFGSGLEGGEECIHSRKAYLLG